MTKITQTWNYPTGQTRAEEVTIHETHFKGYTTEGRTIVVEATTFPGYVAGMNGAVVLEAL